MGRDSSVGIETRYGLDGPENESRSGARFFAPSRPALGPNQPSIQWVPGYRVFPGGKAAVVWRWPPTPSSAEVKERVVLYIYSPSRSSWAVLGWTLCNFRRNCKQLPHTYHGWCFVSNVAVTGDYIHCHDLYSSVTFVPLLKTVCYR